MVLAIEQKIEGQYLEESQKEAILKSGKNILVNAGAGSGKTKTIVGKIIHILDQNLAEPEEIIVVAYNNPVVVDLKKRFKDLSEEFPNLKDKIKRLLIHTFHSYCYDKLKKNKNIQVAEYLDSDEKKIKLLRKANFFEQIIKEISSKDKSFYKKINKYFLNYIQHYKNIFKEIKSMEEYDRAIKPLHICLKTKNNEDNEEIPLEVKSIEELEIANFLYLKGIEFKYEDVYPGKLPPAWERWDRDNSREYRPDFHLIKKDEKGNIVYDEYYEHFALDKNLKNPPLYFRDREKYINDYKIKKLIFNGKLIETYSYQKIDGTLFEELTKQLISRGINVPEENVISDEEAFKQFKKAGYFNVFAKLLADFLTNFKNKGADLNKLKSQFTSNWFIKLFENNLERRARAFIEIFETILDRYEKKLEEEKQLDFEDMLLKGRSFINDQGIKYLIVDEFQDISPLRADVIKKIQDTNKNAQLFVVGDDWQSIYAFSGSDINIMVHDFDKYFGNKNTKDLAITYRFNQRLCELTSSFIQKNPNQLKKNIKGINKFNEVPVEIFKQKESKNFNIDFSLKKKLLENLDNIFKTEESVKKILFLTRYNHGTYRNGYEDLEKYIKNIFKTKKKIIVFSTIHKAKGLEADYVFIINVSDGSYGFPSTIADDPLLKLVKYDPDKNVDEQKQEDNSEERRLFYVALTRTKKKVFIYGEENAYFFKELTNDINIKANHHYNVFDIPIIKKPDQNVVINYVKGNKSEKKEETPAKNLGIESGDIIIEVEGKKYPSKKSLNTALKNSKGKEIKLRIQKKNKKILEILIKPFDKNKGTDMEKKWSLGATYFDREIDPFVESLINKYGVLNQNTKEFIEKHV